MVAVRIDDLSFAYRKAPVLNRISISVEPSLLTAILGPNGSGKSTLLKCINRILTVRLGTILVGGSPVERLSLAQVARIMAYVPQQESATFPATVYETVLMGRKPFIGWGLDATDHAIVAEVLRDLDLESIAMDYLGELSGGQRQRVLIGRALAQKPKLLLLDEPTANLDLRHQFEVMELLQRLAAGGLTCLVAMHDLNLAARYCDRFVMLEEGALFAAGGLEILSEENIGRLYGVGVKRLSHEGRLFFLPGVAPGQDQGAP